MNYAVTRCDMNFFFGLIVGFIFSVVLKRNK